LEKKSEENSGEHPKIKIKRSRRRLYQTEKEEKNIKQKPRKIVEVKVKTDAGEDEKLQIVKETHNINKTREAAGEIIKRNLYWSAGIGLLPFPVFDLTALVALQVKMARDISLIYGLPFRESRGKSIILSLIGGLNMFSLLWIACCSFVKFIPGIASIMSVASSSAFAGATTYAVGKVFIQHFEMGGTLLNFNPEQVRQYFHEQYRQGMENAKAKGKSN
jgi:uncharacterized protein (DUF697 family)